MYLIENGFTNSKNINSVSNRITRSIEKNSIFYETFKAEFLD